VTSNEDKEGTWLDPEGARGRELELWPGPDCIASWEPASPARRGWPALAWLRVVAYGGVAAALVFGGWFARGALPREPTSPATDKLAAALLPEEGITLDVRWGDLPPRLIQDGVIDLEKFRGAAEQAGSPLTPEQLRVLAEGSDEPLRVDANSAYFVLDVLWALGLANRNPILTEGPIAQRGWEEAGGYASTGGWTIGARPGSEYLAAIELLRLTPDEQDVVEEVAFNSYRPCCGNMTAFPDCNHGMAALGLAELMAAQGATADQVFQALKKISPFWFPTQYHHLALYLERQDQEWADVNPRLVMAEGYSSAGGSQQVTGWLQQEGVLTGTGTGAGKASGCAP